MLWSTRLFSTEQVPESHLPSKSTNLYIPLSASAPPLRGRWQRPTNANLKRGSSAMFHRLKVMVVADVTYVLCLDCALSQLDDDSGSVSVDLPRRLRNGVI